MNIKQLLWAASLGTLCIACQQAEKNTVASDSSNSTTMEQTGDDGASPIVFERTKIQGQKDTLTFELQKASTVNIALSTEGKAGNIRINQILMPDGASDGPFGTDYTDSLSMAGQYRIVIGESLMQENPYTGPYRVKIELK